MSALDYGMENGEKVSSKQQAEIKFLVEEDKYVMNFHLRMQDVSANICMSHMRMKTWVGRLRAGDANIENHKHSPNPITRENTCQAPACSRLNLGQHAHKDSEIEAQLGNGRDAMGNIVHDHLGEPRAAVSRIFMRLSASMKP